MPDIDQVQVGGDAGLPCAAPAPAWLSPQPTSDPPPAVALAPCAIAVVAQPNPPVVPYLPPADIVYIKGDKGDPGTPGSAGTAGIYQEPLEIIEQNTIPSLAKPWKAGPGAFANIIIGAATLVNGTGAVTFADGSKAVLFNPDPSTGGPGFNLNPGDVVVAQYNVA